MRAAAIVLAAGRGQRMGQDKALLDLAGTSAVERVVRSCTDGGAASITVVRCAGDAPLPAPVLNRTSVVRVPHRGEMIDSVRAGWRARPATCAAIVVFPVDYALVGAEVVAAVLAALHGEVRIALPVFRDRPGHPIALSTSLEDEVLDPGTGSLRDVVGRVAARVRAVPVASAWVRRDLDTPDDLAAARAWLAGEAAEP